MPSTLDPCTDPSLWSRMTLALLAAAQIPAVATQVRNTPRPSDHFAIHVVDAETGRGIPLVELRTVNDVVHVTDSNGLVAFHEPSLTGQDVFFHLASHGYDFPADRFGQRGKAVRVVPGTRTTLRLKRHNVAERLYRVTGADIYRDTVLLGLDPPIREPLLNARVLGQDSVLSTVYSGKLHWFWGDTNRPGHPLGNFHVPGATSLLPEDGGLDPAVGVDLTYFVDPTGFAKPTCRMPGEGPTWLSGLVVLPDNTGRQRLLGAYVKIRNGLEAYERGIVVFDDATQQFEKVCSYPPDTDPRPDGHAFLHQTDGVDHVYFATAWPHVRVRATMEDYTNPAVYESYTCLRPGSTLDAPSLDRDSEGRLRYRWRRGVPPLGTTEQQRLVKAKHMRPAEARLQLRDIETGDTVRTHNGSVYFNAFRRRWVMVVSQQRGESSFLGEVWYAEADTPTGPWVYARRIITHDKYSFYNPKQHPAFDQSGGRIIYFEGTYTKTFSRQPHPTPRYDYNQIMYRLDLADERLVLPVPVYASASGRWTTLAALTNPPDEHDSVAFFALDRPKTGSVAVCQESSGNVQVCSPTELPPGTETTFHALPAENEEPNTVPLLRTTAEDGTRSYVLAGGPTPPVGTGRTETLCRVWRDPRLPAERHRDP